MALNLHGKTIIFGRGAVIAVGMVDSVVVLAVVFPDLLINPVT